MLHEFPCGCKWPIISADQMVGGLPLMDVDGDNLPDCKAVWEMLGKGLTKGVFQLESQLGRTWTKKLKPENEEHLSALGAILRPGAMQAKCENGISTTQHYVNRKNNLEMIESINEVYDEVLSKTYGLNIYQENSMALAVALAGFDGKQANALRKAIGKKIPEEMAKLEKQFLDGIKAKGIVSEEQGKLIFENIRASQRYSFNHSHAMSYGLLGYDTAYLKVHFPIQFFANWLYYAKEKADPLQEISELIQEAKLMDIEVKTPDIRHLESNFYIDGQYIRFGLTDIKGVGNAAITKLINSVREAEEKYSRKVTSWSWEDFLFFVGNSISSAVLTSMVSVGAFHWTGKSRNRLKNEISAFYEFTEKELDFAKKYYLDNGGNLQSIMKSVAKPKKEGGAASNKNRVAKLQSVSNILENPPSSEKDNLGEIAWMEERLLGISVSCNKVDAFDMKDVNTTCKEYMCGKTGYMVFGVNVDNVRVFKTKNGKSAGAEMAFLTISDATCTLSEVVCFPENWKKLRSNLSVGNVVLIEGERDKNGNSLIVKNACSV